MSELQKQACEAFVKAQKDFAPALKQSTNPHFRSKYVDLAGCVEAVIDALNSNGLALQQFSHERDGGVAIETRLIHESGEVIDCGVLFVPATKQDAQGYGSALTYARRYSLMAACGIAPEDDDGNKATKSAPVKLTEAPVKLTEAPVKLKESDFKEFEEIYCIDMDELKNKYVSIYNRATTKDEQKRLTAIKDAKKIEIEKGVSQ